MNFQFSLRGLIKFLEIYACGLLFAQRSAISIAIVAMVSNKESSTPLPPPADYYDTEKNRSSIVRAFTSSPSSWPSAIILQNFPFNAVTSNDSNNETAAIDESAGEFDWDETLQGIILGSSFYLFCIVPIFAGRITDSVGAKWVTFSGLLFPCLLAAAIPISVRKFDAPAIIILQTLIGGFHGCIHSSLFSLNIKWFPVRERVTAGSGMIAGNAFGNSLMYAITGYLCQSEIGWPLVFYVLSALHVPWLVLWPCFVASDPFDSKRISERELSFIKTHVPRPGTIKKRKLIVPWLRILKSPLVWGCTITKCANSFGYFMLLAKTPSFLSSMFGVSISQNGTYSALVTFSTGISALLTPSVAKIMCTRLGMRSIVVRKTIQAFSSFVPAISMALIPVFEGNQNAAIACIFTAMFFYGLQTGGEFPLCGEFSPNLAGTMTGVLHVLPFATGIVAPYVAGFLLDQGAGSMNDRWNMAFYISAAMFVVGGLSFVIFADDRQQEWDKAAYDGEDALEYEIECQDNQRRFSVFSEK